MTKKDMETRLEYRNALLLCSTLPRKTVVSSEGHNMICGHENKLKPLDEITTGVLQHEKDTFTSAMQLTFHVLIGKKRGSCKVLIWHDEDEQSTTEEVGMVRVSGSQFNILIKAHS